MKTPGITVRPLKQMTDDHEFCEVFFEDVRVPATNLLGAPGAGWSIAMGIVQHERGPMWTFVFQRKIRREPLASSSRGCAKASGASGDAGRSRRHDSGSRRPTSRSSCLRLSGLPEPHEPAPHRTSRSTKSSHGEDHGQREPISACRRSRCRWSGRTARSATGRSRSATARIRAPVPLRALGDDHGRHVRDPAERDRAADSGTAAIKMPTQDYVLSRGKARLRRSVARAWRLSAAGKAGAPP
jgi:hypothetical protein